MMASILKMIAQDFIREDAVHIVLPLYEELVELTRREPLNISYELYVDETDPGHFRFRRRMARSRRPRRALRYRTLPAARPADRRAPACREHLPSDAPSVRVARLDCRRLVHERPLGEERAEPAGTLRELRWSARTKREPQVWGRRFVNEEVSAVAYEDPVVFRRRAHRIGICAEGEPRPDVQPAARGSRDAGLRKRLA